MGLRITTWNVNGIRNPFSYQPWRDKKSFAAMFDILEADIVVLQETKIQRKDLQDDMVLVPGWDCYFSLPKHEKGKFGVVIYTRQSVCCPIRAEEGIAGVLCPPSSSTKFRDLPEDQRIGGYPSIEQAISAPEAPDLADDFVTLDSEGRCVILEFPAFVLLGVYNPATRDDSRNAFRIGFLNLLDIRIRNLVANGKQVVLAGDLNVSKNTLDMANAEVELRKIGMTAEEYLSMPAKRLFNHLLEDGIVFGDRDPSRETPVLFDICRSFHPTRRGMFTHWETKINARPGNYGSRIDYVLCSLGMKDWFSESNIQEGLMGSDHCPVYVVLKEEVEVDGTRTNVYDIMNPPGMFETGRRLQDHSQRDLLPLSGKLLPEFNGRRNIRDMFSKKPPLLNTGSIAPSPPKQSSQPNGHPNATESGNKSQGSKPVQESSAQGKFAIPATRSPDKSPSSTRKNVGEKRALSERGPQVSLKRSKSGTSSSSSTSQQKGQQSLKGFFKSTASSTNETFSTADANAEQSALGPVEPSAEASQTLTQTTIVEEEDVEAKDTESLEESDRVHDPIESKESWSKLFAKPAPPRCEGHGEPCKSMVTRRPGINCGRSFWMCAKPLGPSGQKEKGTEWRCGTFIWCSDWNPGNA